jgi:hypothetical protein
LLDHETFGFLEDTDQWDVRPLNTIGLKGQGKPASLVEVFWNKAESTFCSVLRIRAKSSSRYMPVSNSSFFVPRKVP